MWICPVDTINSLRIVRYRSLEYGAQVVYHLLNDT